MAQIAVLLQDFETRSITKMVNGKPVTETVPRYKKGSKYPVIEMNFFWMTDEEKGGIGVSIGTMDYMRLTFPNGEKTKYRDMFELRLEETGVNDGKIVQVDPSTV